MIYSYFQIALRNLLRNKSFAVISIGGIAVGLAVFSLFALYVADEIGFDQFHRKSDRIVRLVHHAVWDGGEAHHAVTSAAFAPALKQEFPEIEEATRLAPEGGGVITYENKVVKAGGIFFADRNVFDVFTFPFLAGDSKTALALPESIVITEALAKKLFGDAAKALNQSVVFDGSVSNRVTGVMKDIPENSHLKFEALRSLPENRTAKFSASDQYTYLLLVAGADYKELEKKLPAFAEKTIRKELPLGHYSMELQPLTSIHLHSNLAFEPSANGSINRVYLFIALAILVLIIAVINYMNLSTARAFLRIREVGIRKVIGSGKRSLAVMFIIDALVITTVSGFAAFIMITLLLPVFNMLAGKNLNLWSVGAWQPLMLLIGFSFIIGLVAGSYPAWFLSKFKTTAALKGLMGDLSDSVSIRKLLVVFQFVVTAIMITGSIVLYRQMDYVNRKDLGFDKEQVLTFHLDDRSLRSRLDAFKVKLLQNPAIERVAAAGNPIGNNDLGLHSYFLEEQSGKISDNPVNVHELVVDSDFIPTMKIAVIQGRNFLPNNATDRASGILINETLLKQAGWENAIGKKVKVKTDSENDASERTVVGVFHDFHVYSLQYEVLPMVMVMSASPTEEDNLYVRIGADNSRQAIAHLEASFREFDKANPLEIHFLNENFDRQYAAEQRQQQLSLIFTLLSVFIACLGLFGLVAFTSQQRVKEIGVRKVLGASVRNIVTMLSFEYVKLVLISVVIATPVAAWLLNRWLEDFAYRVSVSALTYIAAGGVVLIIAILTVSIQAYKSAMADPVKSLRSE